eukprot:1159006-Pelagomonas_calceolata.AAC.4
MDSCGQLSAAVLCLFTCSGDMGGGGGGGGAAAAGSSGDINAGVGAVCRNGKSSNTILAHARDLLLPSAAACVSQKEKVDFE